MTSKFLLTLGIASALAACSDPPPETGRATDAITVEVVTARRDSIQTWTFAEGTARAARREFLTFEKAGRITFLKDGLKEGDTVTAGEKLVHQDQRRANADIDTAKASVVEAETASAVADADLNQAKTDEELARTTFERFSTLLEKGSASKQEFDEAKAKADKASSSVARAKSQQLAAQAQIGAAQARLREAEISLEETELSAPIDGIVSRLNVQKGFYMTPSLVRTDSEEAFLQTVPLVIIDPGSLEITVDVPPSLRDLIQPGQVTHIQPGGGGLGSNDTPEGFSPTEFPVTGEVYSVTPSVSPGKRAIQVKIRTATGADKLQDGMFATVWIGSERREDVVVAPLGCFIYRDNKPFVFIADPDSKKASLRPVKLGVVSLNEQEISSGVEPGEQMITTGRYQLSDGASVSILEKKAEEEPHQSDPSDSSVAILGRGGRS